MEELVTLSIYAEDYDRLKSWQLTSWCMKRGADEWTLTVFKLKGAGTILTERFAEVTAPFRLPTARRRRLTATGRVFTPDACIRPTELWRLSSASFAVLQEFLPGGLFGGGKEDSFEDPVLYRNGEFMLGVVSHENEGILRVTDKERFIMEAEGFKFRSYGSYVGY